MQQKTLSTLGRRHGATTTLFALLVASANVVHAQSRVDVIRGVVMSDSGKTLSGATVIATRAPDRALFQSQTDGAGRYQIAVPDGTGDYLVYVSAPGFTAFRKRLTRAVDATASDSVLVLDARLVGNAPQQLASVTVRASVAKAKPTRFPDPGTRVGAAEALVDDFAAGVRPDLAGDLTAAAVTLPGVQPSGAGISVLGLDPSQNIATLNGMALGAATLPRAATTETRVSTTTYDPSRGWFGGASTDVAFGGGGVFHVRTAYATVDAPVLQYTDPVSRGLGQRSTSGNVSLGGRGPLDNRDRFFFNVGVQAGRRVNDAPSLLSVNTDVLRGAGIAADSVTQLRTILNAVGMPIVNVPDQRHTDDLSLLVRFDHDPRSVQSDEPAKTTQALTLYGTLSRTSPTSFGPTSTSLAALSRTNASAGAQAQWSTYIRGGYLTTARSSFSYGLNRGRSFLGLPSASVLLTSALPEGDQGVTSLSVGGGTPGSASRSWTWETMAQTQLYVSGLETHRVTITADARLDRFAVDGESGNRAGFAFQSLGDFARGIPVSYSRTSGTPSRAGGVWNAFASVGDLWRVSRVFKVEYGARLEASSYTDRPQANPRVSQLFGTPTDIAPNTMHASPRVGFTWTRRGARNAGSLAINDFGAFNMRPTSYVRGGIGEFRSIMPSTLLSDATILTGLSGGAQRLLCLGDAAPTPNWRAFGADPLAAPVQCATGGQNSALADTAPAVRLVARNYSAPRSWRANLAYESRYRWLVYSFDGTYSLNVRQTGRTDLNFRDTPIFSTADEQRPVFAPSASIVPSSGAVAIAQSRTSPAFSQVLMTHADLRSVSRQLIATVAPSFDHSDRLWVQLSYAVGQSRTLQSGFDASTFGSPFAREWARGALDARHQLLLRSGVTARGVALTLFGQLASGLPYTPIVGDDVNGDGFANDRAYIPSGNSDIARGVNALVSTSPSAERCIGAQRGAVAGAASCEGPWTTALNAQLSFAPKALRIAGHVPYVRLNLANPLGGLDQLLHGASGLRGWGMQTAPDPVLLLVRGFDPAARRFRYEVNPRFANTDVSRSLARAPFRVTFDVRFNLTPDLPRQQLVRYLGPGRGGRPGPRLTVPLLQQRYAREVNDPYASVLLQSDSLLLSRTAIEALQQAQRQYRVVVDSAWRDLATTFAGLGDTYDVGASVERQERTIEDVRELTRLSVRATLGIILDPIQLRLMPGSVIRMFRSEKPLTRDGRTFYGR